MAEAERGRAAVAVLARGLVRLRDNAEGPIGTDLEAETGLGAQIVADALGGERLPALPVTLALVAAWGGDLVAWEEYWNQIAELAGEGRPAGGEEKADDGEAAEQPAKESREKGKGKESKESKETQKNEGSKRSKDTAANAKTENNAEAKGHTEVQQAAKAEQKAETQQATNATDSVPQQADALSVPAPPALAVGPAETTALAGADPKHADQEPVTTKLDLTAEGSTAKAAPADADPKRTDQESGTAKRDPQEAGGATVGAAAAAGSANAEPIPPAKPAQAAAEAEAHPGLHPHRRAHLVLLVLVVLLAAGGGVLAYALTRSGDTSETAGRSPAQPTGASSAGPAPVPATVTITATPSPTPSDTASGLPSAAETSTSAFPTPSFETSTAPATPAHVPGTILGLYPKVQLPSGYSVDLLNDTFHPVPGSTLGGDTLGLAATGPAQGRFVAGQAVLFDAEEPGTFERCLNDTRYQQDVSLAALSVGSLFCVHGPAGELVLVKVDRLPQPQDANPYVMIDLTIWQGR